MPHLETILHKKANKDGMLPLLSPSASRRVFHQYPNRLRRSAAVLVPLVSVQEEPCVLFTVRSASIKTHASEISFPGGHKDPGDASLVDTALRETREELLLTRRETSDETIKVLGVATPLPSLKGIPVTPVLGAFLNNVPNPSQLWKGNKHEVDKVFCVSIQALVEGETMEPLGRLGRNAPVYPTPHGKVWGLTAYILQPILHKILKPVFVDREEQEEQPRAGDT